MKDVLCMLALLVLPLAISVGLVAWRLGRGKWIRERLVVTLHLHEERGLSEQGLLWISIFTPMCYFLALGLIVWSGHSIELSKHGLENFFSISKLPLAVLSLAIPFSVLVSRLHSTKQTAKQISITQKKNNLDLFHAHRKEFFAYFAQIGERNFLDVIEAKFNVHPRAHKIFFQGKPEDGAPSPNESAFKEIEQYLDSALRQLDFVVSDNKHALSFYLGNFSSTMYSLSMQLGLVEICIELANKSRLVPVKLKDQAEYRELLTVGTTTAEAVAAYRYARAYFQNLCDFAGRDYVEDEKVRDHYLNRGDNYLNISRELVIERLHANEIKELIEGRSDQLVSLQPDN